LISGLSTLFFTNYTFRIFLPFSILIKLRCFIVFIKTLTLNNIVNKKCFSRIVFIFALVVIVLQFASYEVNAQVAATYSNEYLNIGVDAASMARGNSIVAGIDGVCAGYWNPSGLVNMNTAFEASLMHSNYFSGLAQYDYLGVSYKSNDSLALGFSVIRFGVDNIPNTLNLIDENGNVDYDRITYFSVADYALLFSIARKSKIKGLSFGGNVKLIYRRQGEFANAYGFGFDFGSQFFIKKWRFGAVLRDASSTFNFWNFNKELFEEVYQATGNKLPENSLELTLPKLLSGISRQFTFSNKISGLLELDLDCSFDGKRHSLISANKLSIDPHAGFQVSYLKNIYLRAGIDRFQTVEDFDKSKKLFFKPSVGFGFYLYGFSLDYALTDVGDLSVAPVSHVFSLKYAFK
jgi:hypothetical protein